MHVLGTTAPPHHRITAPPHHCTTTLPHHRTTAPPHQWTATLPHNHTSPRHPTIIPPHYRTTALSHHRTAAPPHHRTAAPPHHPNISPQYARTTTPLHHRTTALQVLAQLAAFGGPIGSDQTASAPVGIDAQPPAPESNLGGFSSQSVMPRQLRTSETHPGGSSSLGVTATQIGAAVLPHTTPSGDGELPAVRLCIICEEHERVVRFGCGHALVCSRCLVQLRNEGGDR